MIEVHPTSPRLNRVHVTLDVGRAAGAFQGMELYPVEPCYAEWARVVEVGDETSEAVFTPFDEIRPKVGWRLSTARE